MASIKIKNFGPIKEGYTENDGFMPIQKYMAFIGNQGSGKSSVVKLISTFSWIEKALVQGKITIAEFKRDDYFKMYCGHQQIESYFHQSNLLQDGTMIEYRGEAYSFIYDNNKLKIKEEKNKNFSVPKITFIPAERNFLSVIEQAEKVKQLPSTLSWCLEEYTKACRDLVVPVELPINRIRFYYSPLDKTAYIKGTGNDFELRLSEASSGIQSIVPLFIVIDYLNKFIANQKEVSYSLEEREALRQNLEKILSPDAPSVLKDEALKVLFEKYTISHLITIIEEIEQNLFPDSQRAILNKVLEYTEARTANKLILTTHSPYIIGYLTLAMKGYMLKKRINNQEELLLRLENIVPAKSCINPEDVAVYELDLEGKIRQVNIRNGIISGENYLNKKMKEENILFDKLLEIEEELEWEK